MSKEIDQIAHYLNQLMIRLAASLQLKLPQDPEDPAFALTCLNQIMKQNAEQWKELEGKDDDQQEQWIQIIQVLEKNFIEEEILSQGQELTLVQIVKVYEILVELCETLQEQENLVSKLSEEKQNKKPKEKSKSKSKQKKSKLASSELKPQKARQSKIVDPNTKYSPYQQKNLEEQVIKTVMTAMTKTYKKKNPKTDVIMRDKPGKQACTKAKRTLDYAVKQFQEEDRKEKQKRKVKASQKKTNIADLAFKKMIQNKNKKLHEEIENQQLSFYIKLREKKIAYIKHIHKLIEQLERQRQIDLTKQQAETHKALEQQQAKKIENIENIFQNNIEQMKEKYKKRKELKNAQHIDEMNFCRAMEKNIKQKKIEEIDHMKNLWNEEMKKIDLIEKDEQKIKEKLINIYRKHQPS